MVTGNKVGYSEWTITRLFKETPGNVRQLNKRTLRMILVIKWFIHLWFCNMRPRALTKENQTSPLLPLTMKKQTSHQPGSSGSSALHPHRDPLVIKTFPLPWHYSACCCVVEVGDHRRIFEKKKKSCYLTFQCTAGSSRKPLICPRQRNHKKMEKWIKMNDHRSHRLSNNSNQNVLQVSCTSHM